LWFIEAHFSDNISLDDIASSSGVSRFYISRAFATATGCPIVKYIKGRRLSFAALELAQGRQSILELALSVGYGSHEAFTRAFREQFGITPEMVRRRGNIDGLNILEAIKMDENQWASLKPPRFEQGRAMLIAGLGSRYDGDSSAGIPAQWQRFIPYIGRISQQVGGIAYGVCCNPDASGNFDYICGVEVSDRSGLPAEFSVLKLEPHRYAVFTHEDHISTIRRTCNTIWNKFLPESKLEPLNAPDFERYDEKFDGRSGLGGLEIWVPIKS
jgi:AraC family transcriptional regulator